MTRPTDNKLDFAEIIGVLESDQVWEYETGTRGECRDVPQRTFDALQRPADFPPIEAAIVSGDHVALAVDPNVPEITQVIHGTIKALGQSGAGEIDIVLWDEARDETVESIRDEVGDAARVIRHQSSDRASLRYVAADQVADPIYLNRRLVDADFVLPIIAGRPLDTCCPHDLTGIFPAFADSASRLRHREQVSRTSDANSTEDSKKAIAKDMEPAWLLGIQIMISVIANNRGVVGDLVAGTPLSIRKRLTPTRRLPDDFPPPAPLVIASLDGERQQQTWCNAARAVAAASRYAEPEGTIVLWSAITDLPSGRLEALAAADVAAHSLPENETEPMADEFPLWKESTSSARTLDRIAAEHRVIIHSELDNETIESMGLGVIATPEELARLSGSFATCGALRAAQFAGTTFDHHSSQIA